MDLFAVERRRTRAATFHITVNGDHDIHADRAGRGVAAATAAITAGKAWHTAPTAPSDANRVGCGDAAAFSAMHPPPHKTKTTYVAGQAGEPRSAAAVPCRAPDTPCGGAPLSAMAKPFEAEASRWLRYEQHRTAPRSLIHARCRSTGELDGAARTIKSIAPVWRLVFQGRGRGGAWD